MERQSNLAPIIIKRRRRGGEEAHHGGAWKIAYADFVTAMMAFFLLMWLVNATTETQRRGLADYFSPSIPISRVSGGGDGILGGHEVLGQQGLSASGAGEGAGRAGAMDQPGHPDDTSAESAEALAELAEILMGRGGESLVTELALRHVVTRITDEGLIVELFDLPDQPLFTGETDSPEPVLALLADLLTEVFGLVGNGVSIEGHLRSLPVVVAENPVWDLSTARAQRMRQLLEGAGIAPARMRRVTGHADRRPATRDPAVVRNNRLEVILLRDRT